jgi:hypothetical protein
MNTTEQPQEISPVEKSRRGETRKENYFRTMNRLIHLKKATRLFVVTFVLARLAVLPVARAVVPPPDGGYPGQNTAEGTNALFNANPFTGGSWNTAVGYRALFSDTYGKSNTGIGNQALTNNMGGPDNTAVGYHALFHSDGVENTALGSEALYFNTIGYDNTANGFQALYANTEGSYNTANGVAALSGNTIGVRNTAAGVSALQDNTTGSGNIGLGFAAGGNLTTGDNNIDIGNAGVANESRTIRIGTAPSPHDVGQSRTFIAGIYDTPILDGVPVVVNSDGQLGVSRALGSLSPGASSSRRFKQEILRYEAMNTKLRNDFLKEHRKVEALEVAAAKQEKEIKALITTVKEQQSQIQKVSAQIELTKPTPRTVLNDQ